MNKGEDMKNFRQYTIIFLLVVIVILLWLLVKAYWFQSHPRIGPEGIRPIAELATVEYIVVVEVPNEKVPNDIRAWIGAREYLLMLIYGQVKAGFDLQNLSKEDIQTSGSKIRLTLPSPQILGISIDNRRTHIVFYEKSWMVGHDVRLESEARATADEMLRQQAITDGILEKARNHGQLLCENYLRSLGFTDIQVIIK
jgi:hypothetical protein